MDAAAVAALTGDGDLAELGVAPADRPPILALATRLRAGDGSDGGGRVDCVGPLAGLVFSVDNADTLDVDDALSFEFDYAGPVSLGGGGAGAGGAGGVCCAGVCRVGVHIADVASRLPCGSPLFAWAKQRASSAYHGGVREDGEDHGSVPMLPPELAHGELSLNQVLRRAFV